MKRKVSDVKAQLADLKKLLLLFSLVNRPKMTIRPPLTNPAFPTTLVTLSVEAIKRKYERIDVM